MIFSDIVAGNARRVPQDPAWRFGEAVWSWAEANARINRLAHGLRARGIGFQDRIIILADNSNHYLELLLALAKLGAIAVPMTPKSVIKDVAFIAAETDAIALVLSAGIARRFGDLGALAQKLRLVAGWGEGHGLPVDLNALIAAGSAEEVEPSFNDEAIRTIKFTSGTTGAPKGCIGTHRTMFFAVLSTLAQTPEIARGSTALMPLSLGTGLGLNSFAGYAYRNAPTVIMERFEPGPALELIERHRIERSCAVPTIIGALTEEAARRPRDISSLQLIGYSGSPASIPLIRRAIEILGCDFYQAYGSTESGGHVTVLSPEEHRHFVNQAATVTDAWGRSVISCGREAPGVHIRLVDDRLDDVADGEVGEIMVRSASVFSGYWNRPEQTREVLRDGWLITGDMARRTADGFYYVVDRKRDMIVSGGYNVYAIEVEAVLQEHEAVAEAAVVGLFDRRWGEAVHAFVRLRRDAATTPDALTEHCKASLAGQKVPKEIHIVSDFPRTGTGKIRKTDLRAQYRPAETPDTPLTA